MSMIRNIFYFYYDGFRRMTIGRKLWMIIIIKLVILFGIFRIFFFQDFLDKKAKTADGKSDYVIEELTKNAK